MSVHRLRLLSLSSLVVLGLGSSLSPASAQNEIGINFWRNYAPIAPSLNSTDVAGVISQSNWNNVGTVLPDTGSPRTNVGVSLFANNGALSTATLDFTAGKIDVLPSDQVPTAPTDPDKKMMYDYLDTRTTNGITYKPAVTINNLSFAKYDVYVYYDAGTGNNGSNPHNQTAKYTLQAGSLSSVLFGNDHDTFQGTYIQGIHRLRSQSRQ